MEQPWRIELFGWLQATQGDRVVSRFRSQKAGALFAYLAYHLERSHPREALIELLWPESDRDRGRTNLRTELASLRRQLEPPGVAHGAVLLATRATIQVNPTVCATDVARFEAALAAGKRTANAAERAQHLARAAELYRGELLPGRFEDWVLPERQRLAEAFLWALHELVRLLDEQGDISAALQWARRAVAADPLDEESHRRLIRLLLASGRVEAARDQFDQGEALLLRELGAGLSLETRALIQDQSPAKDRLPRTSLGKQGFSPQPGMAITSDEELASAGSSAPQSIGAPVPPGNLPLRLTRFFGREREMEQLHLLLRKPELRLVTMTGPGGTGKTRLALQAAERLRGAFPGGVWFVSLRDLTDATLIPDEIQRALRLPCSPQSDALTHLAACLSRAPALLLLDNYEHLVDVGAEIVLRLLERVDHLTALVTSRQRLGLDGEHEFPLAPLPIPDFPDRMTRSAVHLKAQAAEQLILCPSVQLFVDRAQGARPDFQVTEYNAAAIAAICRCLEGLPLAIELAAARSGVLTPQQMLSRLDRRFDLLVGRQRPADARHRSLRATLDWSYQLLSPELQRFFAQLSVFRGGWTLEAAEAICQQQRALEYLEQLRECSLVQAVEAVGSADDRSEANMRFCLLETMREYGWEQLGQSEERQLLRRRHAQYFTTMAVEATVHQCTPTQWAWMDRLEKEHDNLRAALDWWLVAEDSVESGLRLAGSLWVFWRWRGYLNEGQRYLLAALARNGGSAQARAEALRGSGILALSAGDHAAARPLLDASLAIQREIGDSRELAKLLLVLSSAVQFQGDDASLRALLEEALSLSREIEAPVEAGDSLLALGYLEQRQDDYPSARALYEEALAVSRAGGVKWNEGRCLHTLGDLAGLEGDAGQGRALHEQAAEVFRRNGEKQGVAMSLGWIANFVRHQGDYTTASGLQRQALAIWNELGRKSEIIACLERLASDALMLGQSPESARYSARLLGAAEAWRLAAGALLPASEPNEYDRLMASVRAALSNSSFADAWVAGRALPLEQAVAEALQEAPAG